jgi:hypothetical protein
LQAAMDNKEKYGVWAATTPQEREDKRQEDKRCRVARAGVAA